MEREEKGEHGAEEARCCEEATSEHTWRESQEWRGVRERSRDRGRGARDDQGNAAGGARHNRWLVRKSGVNSECNHRKRKPVGLVGDRCGSRADDTGGCCSGHGAASARGARRALEELDANLRHAGAVEVRARQGHAGGDHGTGEDRDAGRIRCAFRRCQGLRATAGSAHGLQHAGSPAGGDEGAQVREHDEADGSPHGRDDGAADGVGKGYAEAERASW